MPNFRSPDNAPIRAKMVHASSKDALRKSLDGIGSEIQGTDYTEVSYESGLSHLSQYRSRLLIVPLSFLDKVKRFSQ